MIFLLCLLPQLSFAQCFWALVFAGTTCSAQSCSHALSAVIFANALVSRVGFSLATGAIVLGCVGGFLFVDGAEPSSRRRFRFGTPASDLHLYSDASQSGWGAHHLDCLVSGV